MQRDELLNEGICVQRLWLYSLERLLPNHVILLPWACVNFTNKSFSVTLSVWVGNEIICLIDSAGNGVTSINHLSAKTVSFQSSLEEVTPANMSAWITYWRDWADHGHDGSDQCRIPPCSHSYNKSGSGTERLLKDFKPKWRAASSCCVCLCCSPPRSASAYYLLPQSLYLRTNELRVSRARASQRCHGRPPPNGSSSVCLSLWGLRCAYVLSTAAILFYNFGDAQNNTVDNISTTFCLRVPAVRVTDAELLLTHNFLSAGACRIDNLWLG